MIVTNPQSGYLRIFTKYHWLTFMLGTLSPTAIINGQEVPLKWGENVIPAPPGTHRIEIWVRYLWKFGSATIVVDNTQDSPTLHYSAPVSSFVKGAIGFEPQKFPGLTAAYVVYGVFAAVFVLWCCGSFLFNMSGS